MNIYNNIYYVTLILIISLFVIAIYAIFKKIKTDGEITQGNLNKKQVYILILGISSLLGGKEIARASNLDSSTTAILMVASLIALTVLIYMHKSKIKK